MTETNQALSAVEQSSFQNMLSTFTPTAKALTTHNVKERIIDIDCNIRKQSIAKMKGCHVNTCDHWSLKQNFNYVGMTAHWSDVDFKMHLLPLGIFLHEGGSSVALLIDEFLANIAREVSTEATIFAVTTDTDPSMNAVGKLHEEKKIVHLYCTDHVLHLTCKCCYERASFGDVATSAVQKTTNVVSHFQSSTQATAKLLQAQSMIDDYNSNAPITLLTDCVTRWWSTFRMVARILYLRLALSLLEVNNDIPETK